MKYLLFYRLPSISKIVYSIDCPKNFLTVSSAEMGDPPQ